MPSIYHKKLRIRVLNPKEEEARDRRLLVIRLLSDLALSVFVLFVLALVLYIGLRFGE